MATTLVELIDDAAARYGDRRGLALLADDGRLERWTYRELVRRSRLAAWRLRALGLQPGDRLLTWSPSAPALAAAYIGAMRARLVLVPLDLPMSPDAVAAIVARSGARHLVLGTGRDGPDLREAGLGSFPTTRLDDLVADPGPDLAGQWEAEVTAWPPPTPDDLFELIFTSGTTGRPKGVMLAHDNVLAGVMGFHQIVPPMEHRILSLLPLSHLLEQAVGLLYALSVGAEIVYLRSRHPRVILEAIRRCRITSMVVVPQILDLFWRAIEGEVERRGRGPAFRRLRRLARHLPFPARRLLFHSLHRQLGGSLRLFVSSGAFLPPALQAAWEEIGVVVLQGYGATETGSGTCTTLRDHPPGTVGRPVPPLELRIAEDGEVLLRGASLFKGYWDDPQATAEAFTPDGWYRTGDVGHLDPAGRLVLSGRKKDVIVLPNGLNVYPEDVENALREAGIRDAVVLETRPGRIEAVVLPPGRGTPGLGEVELLDGDPAEIRRQIDAAVRAANATLAPHQRVAGWRLWPDADFPRTHTLKVRRHEVRTWAAVETALPVRDQMEEAMSGDRR